MKAKKVASVEVIRFNPTVQGVCKDCGNGTLNNELNEQFVLCDFRDDGNEVLVCRQCGGTHLDVVVL